MILRTSLPSCAAIDPEYMGAYLGSSYTPGPCPLSNLKWPTPTISRAPDSSRSPCAAHDCTMCLSGMMPVLEML